MLSPFHNSRRHVFTAVVPCGDTKSYEFRVVATSIWFLGREASPDPTERLSIFRYASERLQVFLFNLKRGVPGGDRLHGRTDWTSLSKWSDPALLGPTYVPHIEYYRCLITS